MISPEATPAEWFHEMWCTSMQGLRAIVIIEQYCRSLSDKQDAEQDTEEQVRSEA